MKATLKNYRQSPRKVRLVADALRGRRVSHALAALQSLDKKVAGPIGKLIQSAISNAKNAGKTDEQTAQLVISGVVVNEGRMMKRYRPRAFGRATPLRKRSSTIHITLQ